MRSVLAGLACALLLIVPSVAPAEVPASRQQIALSFAPLVKATAPAVVNIYTKRVVRRSGPQSPLLNDPFFRRFFGEQFLGMPRERVQSSLGSGVIVRGEGVVVTNHHVIKGAQEITVVLSDGREFDATLMGEDPRSDLAVLDVDTGGETLPALAMGDSDALEVGDLVLAIGNPFGVGQTVTSGIVSALARTGVGVSDYRFFIQTDAAINPGNSGGALVTMDGRLVGVNTAIFSKDGGGSVGIGFAIPATMVRAVVSGILTEGRAVRPWFGATVQDVTGDIAAGLGLDRPRGALIADTWDGGPAGTAGLRPGDVVVAVEGNPVPDAEGLKYRIATLPVGERAEMTVLRRGERRSVELPLEAPPKDPPPRTTVFEGRNPFAGATIANLSPALADEVGFQGRPEGVVVLRVKGGSLANRVDLRPGDVVKRVNDRPVRTVEQAKQAVSEPQSRWVIELLRGGQPYTIRVGR